MDTVSNPRITTTAPFSRTTWFFKFCECLLAGFYAATLLLFALDMLPQPIKDAIGEYVILASLGLALIGSVFFAWRWHRRERSGLAQSGRIHAWLQSMIRYGLAFTISLYGFGKIMKTQLQPPMDDFDQPIGELNGFKLTWFYYGFSYPLILIVGILQLGGCLLLLYRRTRLLGVMILLPVMSNILFINVFYDISPGALNTSVFILLALLFLAWVDSARLKAAFWDVVDQLPTIRLGRDWVKHGVRLLPFVAAFSVIQSFKAGHPHDTTLLGIWKVERLARNGQLLPANAWLTDTTAWNRVYFSGWQGCALSANPYRYKPTEGLRGDYEFDSLKNSLRIVVRNPKTVKAKTDTMRATLSNRTAKAMRLRGILRGDTLDMQLVRLR